MQTQKLVSTVGMCTPTRVVQTEILVAVGVCTLTEFACTTRLVIVGGVCLPVSSLDGEGVCIRVCRVSNPVRRGFNCLQSGARRYMPNSDSSEVQAEIGTHPQVQQGRDQGLDLHPQEPCARDDYLYTHSMIGASGSEDA